MATRWVILLVLLFGLGVTSLADVRDGGLTGALRALSLPLRDAEDLGPVVDAAREARLVLLGEASHGTREFYAWRDRLSRRLVGEQDISFIAIEGDWSTLLPLDRYVRHDPGAPASARDALRQVERWPRWVWANNELAALAEWLRAFNAGRPPGRRVGIHGIDLYAIWESLDAVQAFYRARLPEAAARVHDLYGFLRLFRGRYRAYADYVRRTGQSARMEVAWVARELAGRYRKATPANREALFEALQHARVVESGERYLRLQARRGAFSWNARADHFAKTVERLLDHYGPGSRAIVWAHNTHVGDARATDMVRTGEVNLGQLVRERHGRRAVFVAGFGTGTGAVRAARQWEGCGEIMQVPRPRPDSLEAALLASGEGDRLLMLDSASPVAALLHMALPHRAIGVVYEPEHERAMSYIPTRLVQRYDAFIFLPVTQALEPMRN